MPQFFIDRPIFAWVLAILITLGGVLAITQLPSEAYPPIAPPQVVVSASYPGADAATVESTVTQVIEQQLTGIDNLLYFTSNSASDGSSQITLTFENGSNPDIAAVQTQNRVTLAQPRLPTEVVQQGIRISKSSAGFLGAIALQSSPGGPDQAELNNVVASRVLDQMQRIQGVASASQFGSEYGMRIWLDPDKLRGYNMSAASVLDTVRKQNVQFAAGSIGTQPAIPGQQVSATVTTEGRFTSPEQFENILLRTDPNGTSVRLKDVARIELGAQVYTLRGRLNGQPAAVIALYQLPGSNALDVSKAARKYMEEAKKRFPADLDYAISLDTTLAVSQGIKEISKTLWQALLLVILVVFIFLQGWRASLIPLLAVPVSLIGTFVLFPLFGFSINTLSLFGLVLAIGLVVDDAIVVVEAVQAKIDEGLTPHDAAIAAMDEVGGALVGIALVLTSVFIPAGFILGITGSLYRQFALTIACSVLLSMVNALTYKPAQCALILRPRAKDAPRGLLGRFFAAFDRVFTSAQEGYVRGSHALIRKAGLSLLVLAAFAAFAVGLGKILPRSFMPQEDQGYFLVNVQLPEAASLQRTNAVMRKVDAILKEQPGVHYINSVSGFSILSQTSSPRSGLAFVQLAPYDERATPALQADAVVAALNAKLGALPDAQAVALLPPAIPGVGQAGGVDFFIQDRAGNSLDYLWQNAQRFMAELRNRPEIAFLNTTFTPAAPQLFAHVDEDRVLKLGVPIRDVYGTLQALLGGNFVNQFNRFGRVWRVFLEADPQYRTDPSDIGLFYVRNANGDMVPLSTLVDLRKSSGPEFVTRFNEYRGVEIFAVPAPGYSTGQAMAAVAAVADQVLPRDMGYAWNGMSYQESIAGSGLGVFALSLILVFLILAALYQSWSLPFSVLLSTPIAVAGAFVGLWMRRLDNNVYAQIGLIMLIGLSAKNAILIVEYAKAELEKGASLVDAALNGARRRLRPILMTSFAFIFGLMPLWNALGAGAVARRLIGTVTITGMLFSTGIAIFLVPVLFVVVERVSQRWSRRRVEARPAAPGTVPAQEHVS